MNKAAGIIGIIAGIFGFIAAIVTLVFGGLGSAFGADRAASIVNLGFGGILFSFLAIVFSAIVFSRPKGAGIGLIVVSLAGAILGGTLVAVCMSLSLLAGVLALIGGKKQVLVSEATSLPAKKNPTSKRAKYAWIVASVVICLVAIFAFIGNGAQKQADPMQELAKAKVDSLQPTGELPEIFSFGSDSTNLQRENKVSDVTGKVVEWTLPVYEVSKSGTDYKIQTKGNRDLIGAFVRITPRNENDRVAIEALKTGDLVSFKGRISGVTLRSIDIHPAMLPTVIPIVQVPNRNAVEPVSATQPTLSASAPVLQSTPTSESVGPNALVTSETKVEVPQTVDVKSLSIPLPKAKTEDEGDTCQGLNNTLKQDQLECSQQRFTLADKELNAAYQNLKKSITTEQGARLKVIQLAWIKEKDTLCLEQAKKPENHLPTDVAVMNCKTHMTERQTSYLENYKNGL